MTDPSRDRSEPAGSEPTFSDSFAAAAKGSGIGKVTPGEAPTGHALIAAMGGIRGLVESILPGLGFLIIYTITFELLPSVLIPVALAVVFVIVRLVSRSPATPAIAGVVGLAISALIAIFTGRAEDNFILGFVLNAAYFIALGVSMAFRWPLIGVIAGLLTGDVAGWRDDRAKVKVANIATTLWMGLFGLRLLVELPLYFSGQIQWLAATKLLMGVPLYAGLLWVTWLLMRTAYTRPRES